MYVMPSTAYTFYITLYCELYIMKAYSSSYDALHTVCVTAHYASRL